MIRLAKIMPRYINISKRWKFFLLGILRIVDGLIIVLSFAHLTSDIYAEVLFSDWFSDCEDR